MFLLSLTVTGRDIFETREKLLIFFSPLENPSLEIPEKSTFGDV